MVETKIREDWKSLTNSVPMSTSFQWPRISIITPNYNHGHFLEDAIRSVLLQGYPNLEYVIIDGGSTDHSLQIIKKYEPWLSYWVSEKDEGCPFAINKGFERASGEIIGWVLSTDYLLPGALKKIALYWTVYGPALYYGRCQIVSAERKLLSEDILLPPITCTWKELLRGYKFPMASVFFPREVIDRKIRYDETITDSNDWDFCLKVLELYPARYLNMHLVAFRIHAGQYSGSHSFNPFLENLFTLKRQWHRKNLTLLDRLHIISALGHWMVKNSMFLRNKRCWFRAIFPMLLGYMLDWQEWRRRFFIFLSHPLRIFQRVYPKTAMRHRR